jgi:hypothetical protein
MALLYAIGATVGIITDTWKVSAMLIYLAGVVGGAIFLVPNFLEILNKASTPQQLLDNTKSADLYD